MMVTHAYERRYSFVIQSVSKVCVASQRWGAAVLPRPHLNRHRSRDDVRTSAFIIMQMKLSSLVENADIFTG